MDRHTPTREQKIDRLFMLTNSTPPCIEEGFEVIIWNRVLSESDLRLIRRALITEHHATDNTEAQKDCMRIGSLIGAHLDLNEYNRSKNNASE